MPAFAALRVPAYRRLLLAITVMEIGLFAFETALYWTVLEETGSAARVSLLFTGLVVPALLLTIPVGVLVDRSGPKGILLWGSVAAAAVMGLAAFAAGSGRLGFELALLLAIAEGVFFGCYAVPAQVIAGRVVDRSLIASAVGMSALPAGIGAIVGGALGGALLEVGGPAPTFVVACVGLGLSAVTIVGLPNLPGLETSGGMALSDLRSAARWLRESSVASAVVLLSAVAGLFVMSRFGLLPVVVRDVLAAGPGALGLLTTAGGIGTLAGTFGTEVLGRRLGRGRALLAALGLTGLGLAALGLTPLVPAAAALAAVIAASTIVWQLTTATVLQLLAPPRMRGRVLALNDVVRLGLVPVGSLAAGIVVDQVGVATVLVVYGGLTVVAVAVTAVASRSLRAGQTWEVEGVAEPAVSGATRG
jgi:predicted MFS family arabinose efflux permease